MGTQQSTLQKSSSLSQQNINIPYTINHPRLLNVQLYPMKNIMKVYLPIHQQQQIEAWQKMLQKVHRQNLNKQHILLPCTLLKQINAIKLCGNYQPISVLYQFYPYVLIDQLQNRNKLNEQFSQAQLWYILWVLTETAKKLYDCGLRVGDIRPHNILFNEQGQAKVICQLSFPSEANSYQKCIYQKTKTYLSPQQLHLIHNGQQTDDNTLNNKTNSIDMNIVKSQSFAIGLTMLSLITLKDMAVLYSNDNNIDSSGDGNSNRYTEYTKYNGYYGVDVKQMSRLLNKYCNNTDVDANNNSSVRYSNQLLTIITRLCNIQLQSRLTYIKLHTALKQHKYNILQLKPFTLNNNSMNMNINSNININNNKQNQSSETVNINKQVNTSVVVNKDGNNMRQNIPIQIRNIHVYSPRVNSNNVGITDVVKTSCFDTPMRILQGIPLQSNNVSRIQPIYYEHKPTLINNYNNNISHNINNKNNNNNMQVINTNSMHTIHTNIIHGNIKTQNTHSTHHNMHHNTSIHHIQPMVHPNINIKAKTINRNSSNINIVNEYPYYRQNMYQMPTTTYVNKHIIPNNNMNIISLNNNNERNVDNKQQTKYYITINKQNMNNNNKQGNNSNHNINDNTNDTYIHNNNTNTSTYINKNTNTYNTNSNTYNTNTYNNTTNNNTNHNHNITNSHIVTSHIINDNSSHTTNRYQQQHQHIYRTASKIRNKRHQQIQQEQQLLARVDRTLSKSKQLFPNIL